MSITFVKWFLIRNENQYYKKLLFIEQVYKYSHEEKGKNMGYDFSICGIKRNGVHIFKSSKGGILLENSRTHSHAFNQS